MKMYSTNLKQRHVMVTIIEVLLIVFIAFVVVFYSYKMKIYSHRPPTEEYVDCTGDFADMLIYCNEECYGEVGLSGLHGESHSSISLAIGPVYSLDEANENIILINQYVSENADLFGNDNYYLACVMMGPDLFFVYEMSIPGDEISHIELSRESITNTDNDDMLDLRVNWIDIYTESITPNERTILNQKYPDAEIRIHNTSAENYMESP